MNLKDFCDGVKTREFIQQFINPYKDEWVRRTGVTKILFPHGKTEYFATDVIHILNLLRSYKEPVNARKLIVDTFGSGTEFQAYCVGKYLEGCTAAGIVKSYGTENPQGIDSLIDRGTFIGKMIDYKSIEGDTNKFKVLEERLPEYDVVNIRVAPIDKTHYLATNLKHIMQITLGNKPDPTGKIDSLNNYYPGLEQIV